MRDLPSEVTVGPDDGLPKACVVNLDNVTLVDAETLGDVITTLGPDTMGRLCAALNIALGCDHA